VLQSTGIMITTGQSTSKYTSKGDTSTAKNIPSTAGTDIEIPMSCEDT
jgi:hypothetical protein